MSKSYFLVRIPSKVEIRRRAEKAFEHKRKRETQQSEKLCQYLRKIQKIPPMNLREENRLWKQIKEREGDKEAEEKIVKANLRTVIPVAKKYKDNPYLTFLELLLEGEKGLYEAMRHLRWGWQIGEKFSSRSPWWIRKAITNAIRRERRQLLYGRNMEIFVWRDKKGHITDINFSYIGKDIRGYGQYQGTDEEKQKYGQKLIEVWRELARAEERFARTKEVREKDAFGKTN